MLAKLRRAQAGDTIVEVMVVLAILGFAISISYATASKSLKAAQAAQESSQASSLLLGQLEALRELSGDEPTNPDNIYLPTNTQFCINTDVSGGNPQGNPHIVTTLTDPACVRNMGGFDVSLVITANPSGSEPDTFMLKATWDDIEGGQASSSLTYRVHRMAGL